MPCGNQLQTFTKNGFGEDGCGSGAVASHVIGLAGGFLDELCTHVFNGVGELNIFSNRDAVFGHVRAAPTLVQNSIAATRTESGADGPG